MVRSANAKRCDCVIRGLIAARNKKRACVCAIALSQLNASVTVVAQPAKIARNARQFRTSAQRLDVMHLRSEDRFSLAVVNVHRERIAA